jgi:hypothetical protein
MGRKILLSFAVAFLALVSAFYPRLIETAHPHEPQYEFIDVADVDGDGLSDVCYRDVTGGGIVCRTAASGFAGIVRALSTGNHFKMPDPGYAGIYVGIFEAECVGSISI